MGQIFSIIWWKAKKDEEGLEKRKVFFKKRKVELKEMEMKLKEEQVSLNEASHKEASLNKASHKEASPAPCWPMEPDRLIEMSRQRDS